MTKEEAILVLDSLSTWFGHERPITEEIVEAIKTLSKPFVPSNLDEAAIDKAAEEYAFDNADNNSEYMNSYFGFKAGAKWDREQMMKETVEGEVVSTSDNGWECIRIYKKLHKCDDKVKLIIVKED